MSVKVAQLPSIRWILLNFNGIEFEIQVSCSKGTYIRSLIEDIGESLGVGAHVTSLHRLYTNGFENQPMYTLEELMTFDADNRNNYLLPMDYAIDYLPFITLNLQDITCLQQGKLINYQTTLLGNVRLQTETGAFVGLGEINEQGVLKVKRLLAY